MHYGWMSIAIPKLLNGEYDFKITSDEGSWLATMLSMGSFIGDIGGYLLINRFGKKNLILWTALPLVISWILTTVGPSLGYLFAGKLIAGISDGVLFTTVPTFMAEIADPKIRGILGSSYSVTLVLGMLLMNILLYVLPMKTSGYIAIVLNLPIFLTLPFVPDSAYFYIMKNNPDAAKASLQKYFGKAEIDDDLARITKAVTDETENEGGVLEIIRNKTYRKALMISVVLCVLNQFTGIVGILMYCTTVFEESKSIMDPELSNILFFIVYFIAMTTAAFIVDKFGRRPLLIFSSCGAVLCLGGSATFLLLKQYSIENFGHFEYVQLVTLLLHVAVYAFGLNSIPILVASEVFTPNMKGIGLCITNISYSISATIVLKYLTWSTDLIGMFLPFYTFVFWAFVTILFAIYYLPETKGKTLETIQSLLSGEKEIPEMNETERKEEKQP